MRPTGNVKFTFFIRALSIEIVAHSTCPLILGIMIVKKMDLKCYRLLTLKLRYSILIEWLCSLYIPSNTFISSDDSLNFYLPLLE